MTQVHSTAIVDAKAELDPTVSVGPYAVIGPHVRVGAGTTIGSHCVIEGRTTSQRLAYDQISTALVQTELNRKDA